MEQLEFNITNESELEIRISEMEQHIDGMHQTMDKMRKKLFSQLGDLHKLCLELQHENKDLKAIIRRLTHEEETWVYGQENSLFDVREYQAK